VLTNGSLAVSEVYMEDSGMYGCTAENSGGPQRTEVHLHVTSTCMSCMSRPPCLSPSIDDHWSYSDC